MLTKIERIESFSGRCFLALSDLDLRCAFRVFERHGLKHARGKFENLPYREALRALLARKALDLVLEDGRRAQIQITDVEGHFTLRDLQ